MSKKKTHAEYVAELAVKNPDIEVVGIYMGNKVKIPRSPSKYNLQINSKLPILCNVDGEVFEDISFNFKLIPNAITVTNAIPCKIKRMIYNHSNI